MGPAAASSSSVACRAKRSWLLLLLLSSSTSLPLLPLVAALQPDGSLFGSFRPNQQRPGIRGRWQMQQLPSLLGATSLHEHGDIDDDGDGTMMDSWWVDQEETQNLGSLPIKGETPAPLTSDDSTTGLNDQIFSALEGMSKATDVSADAVEDVTIMLKQLLTYLNTSGGGSMDPLSLASISAATTSNTNNNPGLPSSSWLVQDTANVSFSLEEDNSASSLPQIKTVSNDSPLVEKEEIEGAPSVAHPTSSTERTRLTEAERYPDKKAPAATGSSATGTSSNSNSVPRTKDNLHLISSLQDAPISNNNDSEDNQGGHTVQSQFTSAASWPTDSGLLGDDPDYDDYYQQGHKEQTSASQQEQKTLLMEEQLLEMELQKKKKKKLAQSKPILRFKDDRDLLIPRIGGEPHSPEHVGDRNRNPTFQTKPQKRPPVPRFQDDRNLLVPPPTKTRTSLFPEYADTADTKYRVNVKSSFTKGKAMAPPGSTNSSSRAVASSPQDDIISNKNRIAIPPNHMGLASTTQNSSPPLDGESSLQPPQDAGNAAESEVGEYYSAAPVKDDRATVLPASNSPEASSLQHASYSTEGKEKGSSVNPYPEIKELTLPDFESFRKPKTTEDLSVETRLPSLAGLSGAELTNEIRQYIQQRASEKTRELWNRKGVKTTPREEEDGEPTMQAQIHSQQPQKQGRNGFSSNHYSWDDITYDRADSIATVKRLHRKSEWARHTGSLHKAEEHLQKKFSALSAPKEKASFSYVLLRRESMTTSGSNSKPFSRPPSLDQSTYLKFPRRNSVMSAQQHHQQQSGKLRKRQLVLAALAIVSFQRLLLGMISRVLI